MLLYMMYKARKIQILSQAPSTDRTHFQQPFIYPIFFWSSGVLVYYNALGVLGLGLFLAAI